MITDAQELEEKFRKISSIKFGGKWRIKDQKDRDLISPHLNNINGIVKTKLEYHKDSSLLPTLRLNSIMHDGKYRDQVISQKISFNETVIRKKENKIFIHHKKATVEISIGHLYSIAQDHYCLVDVNATFEIISNNHIKGQVFITSDGSCFPEELVLDIEYPNEYALSKRRVFNYAILLTLLLIVYCYIINKQCIEAELNQAIAIRMSMTTLSWNTIWNFCLFNIYLSYALQLQDYGYFAIPA